MKQHQQSEWVAMIERNLPMILMAVVLVAMWVAIAIASS